MISENGVISEGNFYNGIRNGLCILYVGQTKSIYIGYFNMGVRYGNFMELDDSGSIIINSGFYNKDKT